MKRILMTCILIIYTFILFGQNWDINTLHKINGWNGRFMRGYSNAMSKSCPYLSIGRPATIAIYGVITKKHPPLAYSLYLDTLTADSVLFTS